MPDTANKMILAVEGEKELERLNAELEKEKTFLLQLLEIQKQGVVGVNPADIQMAGQRMVALTEQMNQLKGRGGLNGQGILGVSYAMQDFISVMQTGGGFGRALGSMANNVTALAAGLGAGPGIAGGLTVLTAAISAGITMWEKWGGASKEALEETKKKSEELAESIKKTNAEFEKLASAATPGETEEAKRLIDFLKQRPHAEDVRTAVMKATGADVAQRELTPQEQRQYQALITKAAELEQAQIFVQGRVVEYSQERLQADQLIVEGARRRASRIVNEMIQAGPRGEAARREARQAARGQLAADLEQPPPTREFQAEIEAKGAENNRRFQRQQEVERERKNEQLNQAGEHFADQDQREKERQDKKDLDDDLKRIRAAVRQDEKFDRDRNRAAQDERNRELRQRTQLGRAASQVSMQTGHGMPTIHQANEMADMALRNMQEGMNAQVAVWQAVMTKVQAINAMAERNRRLQIQMQMPPDMGFLPR